ncbi:MAG TPA: peptidylprolyl isomerase [Verrucomicrobiae bacterium]
MKFKFILPATLAVTILTAQAATSGTPAVTPAPKADAMTSLFGDPVIVKGKGLEVHRSELDSIVTGAKSGAAAAGQQVPADFDIIVLNQLITTKLLLQKATDADQTAGKAEADTMFKRLKDRAESPEAFQRQLKLSGLTEQELQSKLQQETVAKQALKRELAINITTGAIQTYYSNHAAAFEEPEKAHVRHILLMTIDPATRSPLSTNTVAAKRKQIEDLLKRAKGTDDFSALAKEFSEDTSTKINGGELPAFSRGEMVPEFEAAAFNLSAGQISDVVQSMYGFHIIKLIDKTAAKKFGLNEQIPQISKSPADLCKAELETEKLRELAPDYVQKLRKEYGVEIVDPALQAQEQALMDAATNAPAAAPATNP